MTIQKIWAMPNSRTFKIKPIQELVKRFCLPGKVIIDPFANESKYGTITNDLNPEYGTTYSLDALEFLKMMETESADVVLYDPPYSLRQASECYKNFGKEHLTGTVTNQRYWADCRNEVARIVKSGGVVIHCGWQTNAIGKKRGFKQVEILIVSHGGAKYDTLVTVEQKE